MKKFFKRYFWTILVVLASLGLAGSAAFFSVSGLSKLFAGSALQIIIMASFIELGKIITTAALHRYWKATNWMLKTVLTFMVVIIMGITSSGIYGFLADAYSATAIELEKINGQIELVEKKQELKREKIVGINETKGLKTTRIKSLMELRGQQENRVDSLNKKNWYNAARRAKLAITKSDEEIAKLGEDIDSLIAKTERVNDEIGVMDIDILNLKNSDVATEIGPLKYMSTVTGSTMENIINWFILAIILVFDPLAILLIIFANVVYDKANEKNGPPTPAITPPVAPTPDLTITPAPDVTVATVPSSAVITSVDKDEEYKKIIDAINNTDPEIHEFSYDFEGDEDKGEEVVEYVANENGSFEKTDEVKKSIASLIQGIDSNPAYLQLLDALFLDGARKIGDIIPPYIQFFKEISEKGIKCEEKVVSNFLIICNLMKITDMSNKDKVTITKDYKDSKYLISLIS